MRSTRMMIRFRPVHRNVADLVAQPVKVAMISSRMAASSFMVKEPNQQGLPVRFLAETMRKMMILPMSIPGLHHLLHLLSRQPLNLVGHLLLRRLQRFQTSRVTVPDPLPVAVVVATS
jgi:hypothetical protein